MMLICQQGKNTSNRMFEKQFIVKALKWTAWTTKYSIYLQNSVEEAKHTNTTVLYTVSTSVLCFCKAPVNCKLHSPLHTLIQRYWAFEGWKLNDCTDYQAKIQFQTIVFKWI